MKRILPAKRVLRVKQDKMTVYNFEYGANIIISPNGKIYLFDCGTDVIGEQMADFLIGLGKNTIEAIFISHYHFNHVEGVIPIVERLNVKNIISNGVYSADTREPYASRDPQAKIDLLDVVNRKGIPYIYKKHGYTFQENDLKFTVWSPLEQHANFGGYTNDPNGPTGMMLRVEYGSFSILFGGDVYRPSDIEEIWNVVGDVSTTCFAWPHHGDFVTAKDEVIDPMNLKIALVEYIGSASNTISYLADKGIDYMSLADGMIKLNCYSDGDYEKI